MNHGKHSQETGTRSRLLAATQECLKEGGMSAATSRSITARAGANLGAIRYHFGSKDVLVCEALLDAVDRWLHPVLDALEEQGDPATRTVRATEALRMALRDARAVLPMYFQALLASPRTGPLHEGVRERIDRVRALLGDQIAALQRHGQIPAWADPAAMASLQLALVNGIALHAVLEGDDFDADMVASQFVLLLLAAAPAAPHLR